MKNLKNNDFEAAWAIVFPTERGRDVSPGYVPSRLVSESYLISVWTSGAMIGVAIGTIVTLLALA